jgi:uncharacterized membrane protein required for colicin V production
MSPHVIADLAIVGVIFFATLFGLARGIFKEIIALASLVGATWVAVHGYSRVGPYLAGWLALPADAGLALGALVTWVAAYGACLFLGGRLVKKLRGPKPREDDSQAGPVSRKLAPIRYGIVYWTDKVLGAALGLAKGVLVVVVFLFVASDHSLGRVGAATRGSHSMEIFREHVRPELATVPEVRVVLSFGKIRRIAAACEQDPARWERVAKDPALEHVRAYPPMQELAKDQELIEAVKGSHWADAARDKHLIALLKDREFIRLLAEVDYDRLLADVEAPDAPDFLDTKR